VLTDIIQTFILFGACLAAIGIVIGKLVGV